MRSISIFIFSQSSLTFCRVEISGHLRGTSGFTQVMHSISLRNVRIRADLLKIAAWQKVSEKFDNMKIDIDLRFFLVSQLCYKY